MKTLFCLAVGFFTAMILVPSSFAGPERFDGKEAKSMVQPAVEEPCNWTGFYIGAHVGYGLSNLTWTDTDSGGLGSEEVFETGTPEKLVEHWQDGIIAGGQFGYNHQFGNLVIGLEGDFSYSDVSRSSVVGTDSFDNTFKTRSDWMGSFGFRIGFAYHHFLFYTKDGVAVAHQNYSLDHTVLNEGTPFPVDKFRADEVRVGPMVGGGVEYAITCHWSAKIEYTYLLLGTDDINGTNVEADGGPEPESYQVKINPHTVRIGLNYKF